MVKFVFFAASYIALWIRLILAHPQALVQPRQSIPSTLPDPWVSLGCWTDNPAQRGLHGPSTVDATGMTIESCLAFCTSKGNVYAGVEFGQECYCDIILFGTTIANDTDCNMACVGNSTELCGGPARFNLFWNTHPPPTTTDYLGNSKWRSIGCYSDNVNDRTLSSRTETSGPVTPESCSNACRDAGAVYMGLEFGDECWCGNSFNGNLVVANNECNMICTSDSTNFCGAANRLNMWHHERPPPEQYNKDCITPMFPTFDLIAQYKEPPVSGPTSYALKAVDVLTIPGTNWTVLSACPDCPTSWRSFSYGTDNGFLIPGQPAHFPLPGPQISIDLYDGESILFATQATLPSGYLGYAGYCEGATPFALGGHHVLIGNGHPDLWSLCPNTTAGGRLDIVLHPQLNHPHYDRRDCGPVDILIYEHIN